jgi:hypothetical protein
LRPIKKESSFSEEKEAKRLLFFAAAQNSLASCTYSGLARTQKFFASFFQKRSSYSLKAIREWIAEPLTSLNDEHIGFNTIW